MTRKKILLFLVGAFSLTQIKMIGYIGISELIMVLVGPFVLVKYWPGLKKDGFLPFLMLTGLWVFSAVISDWYRNTQLNDSLRGVASPIVVFFVTCCLYALLRDDIKNFKWAVVGLAVTMVLSTYVVPSGTVVSYAETYGLDIAEVAQEKKLASMAVFNSILLTVPVLFFLSLPGTSLIIIVVMAGYSLIQGGRSAFLCYLLSAVILFVGGRTRKQINRVSKKILSLAFAVLCTAFVAKEVYEMAVIRGVMGDEELKKYEQQVKSKIGLLSGRSQIISVFYAVCDSPVLGHGSWALDLKGYEIRAMEWLEDDEALERYYKIGRVGHIKGHAHIWQAYTWHGIFGAVFWVYVLAVIWRTLSKRLGVVPEAFAYLALSIPALLWAIFFSPFSDRVQFCLTAVVCLLVRRIDVLVRRNENQYLGVPLILCNSVNHCSGYGEAKMREV